MRRRTELRKLRGLVKRIPSHATEYIFPSRWTIEFWTIPSYLVKHHSALPTYAKLNLRPTRYELKFWRKTLGIKKGMRVLVPFSFSGEWAKLAEHLAGKGNVVALDFSKRQVMRADVTHRITALAQELPFKRKTFDKVFSFEPSILFTPNYLASLPTISEMHRVGREVVILGDEFLHWSNLKKYTIETRAKYEHKKVPRVVDTPVGKFSTYVSGLATPLFISKIRGGSVRKQEKLASFLKRYFRKKG